MTHTAHANRYSAAALNAKTKYGDAMGKATAFFAVYTVFYEVFGGFARWILVNAHALFINNIPSVSAILLFMLYFVVTPLLNQKFEKFMIYLLIFIGICFVTFIFNDITADTAIFGFYVIAPFLLGALLCVYGKEETLFKYMPVFWICAIVGVFMNYFFKPPWVGLAYEVNGMQMAAAKEWYANGFERLVGFGRANYATAGVTFVACCYMLSSDKYSTIKKIAIYFFSGFAIFLTTSKAELVAMAALPFYVMSYEHIKFLAPQSKFHGSVSIAILMTLAAMVVFLPLTLGSGVFSNFSGQFMFFSTYSMLDRINHTWPMNFKVLEDNGNYIFGRGIGGIGTSQIIMTRETPDKSTSDNLFLFVLIFTGLVGVIPMFWGLVRNLRTLFKRNEHYFYTIGILTFGILFLGMTENLMEDPIFSLLLGFLVARGYVEYKPEENVPSIMVEA